MNFHNALKIDEHLWGFDPKSMSALLRRHGYEIVFGHDYPVRHRYFQPANLLWFPTLREGIGRGFSKRSPYHFQKSLIAVFDLAASKLLMRGSGLTVLARKGQH